MNGTAVYYTELSYRAQNSRLTIHLYMTNEFADLVALGRNYVDRFVLVCMLLSRKV